MEKLISALFNALNLLAVQVMKVFTGNFWNEFGVAEIQDNLTVSGAFDNYLPGMITLRKFFLAVALSLIVMMLLYNLAKVMLGDVKFGPVTAVGRYGLSMLLVIFSYQIMYYVQSPFAAMYSLLQKYGTSSKEPGSDPNGLSDTLTYNWQDSGPIYEHLTDPNGSFGLSAAVAGLISLGLLVGLLFAYIRLMLEMIERYIVVCLLFYTCPLGFALAASPDGEGFRKWIQMVISEYILMMFNLVFLYVFCYGYSHCDAEDGVLGGSAKGIVIYMCLMIGWCSIGTKVDQYLRSLGLGVAQTGGATGYAVTSAIGAMVMPIVRGGFRKSGEAASGHLSRVTGKTAVTGYSGGGSAGKGMNPSSLGKNGSNTYDTAQAFGSVPGGLGGMKEGNVARAEDLAGMAGSGAKAAAGDRRGIRFQYGETAPDGKPLGMEMRSASGADLTSQDCLHANAFGADGVERLGVWNGSAEQAMDHADAFGASRLESALNSMPGVSDVSPVRDCPGAFRFTQNDQTMVAEVDGLYRSQAVEGAEVRTLGKGVDQVRARFTPLEHGMSYTPLVGTAGGGFVSKPRTSMGTFVSNVAGRTTYSPSKAVATPDRGGSGWSPKELSGGKGVVKTEGRQKPGGRKGGRRSGRGRN